MGYFGGRKKHDGSVSPFCVSSPFALSYEKIKGQFFALAIWVIIGRSVKGGKGKVGLTRQRDDTAASDIWSCFPRREETIIVNID